MKTPKTIFWEKQGKFLPWILSASIAPIIIWRSNWAVIPYLLVGIWMGIVFYNHIKSLKQ
jgi:hypothetical protein